MDTFLTIASKRDERAYADTRIPDEVTRRIMQLNDPPHVLVMSTHESGSYEAPALAAGAIGFLPKSLFGMDALEETWAGRR